MDSTFAAATVVYLGWPAQFRWIVVRPGNALGQLRAVDPASCAAIIFCGMKPPDWLQPRIVFASKLSIVPMRQEIK